MAETQIAKTKNKTPFSQQEAQVYLTMLMMAEFQLCEPY